MSRRLHSGVLVTLIVLATAVGAAALLAQGGTAPTATAVTTPRQQFGHDIGDDYVLVNYTQYVDYLKRLDRESDRLLVVDIGATAEGRTGTRPS